MATLKHLLPRTLCLNAALACTSTLLHGQATQFAAPTPEELSMTAQPQAPNAPAVYLFREQTTEDTLHMFSFYERVKVLTEGGKDKANVELPFLAGEGGYTIDNISARTIHADGTIIPFTGKPYEKLVVKAGGYKYMAKVFTLPSVEVGSILEYRYKLRMDDNWYRAPEWDVQSELFTRKSHYQWLPSPRVLVPESEGGFGSVAWTPILPADAKVVQTVIPGGQAIKIELTIADVPPLPKEEYMPPPDSLSYRVMFYYTSYRTQADYWKNIGKDWSKRQDSFIGPGDHVKSFVAQTVSPSDAPTVKLKKLYDAVEAMDNTRFSREHTVQEDKAAGFKEVKNTDDVLARKRGSDDQLTELFIAMARAAGFKAYAMGVSDREKRIFIPQYLSTRQLDDLVAIVIVDGKEQWFDPGQRYTTFGHLSWLHAHTAGLRQAEGGGTDIIGTPGEIARTAHTQRVADLTIDEHGEASGTITITEEGDPALRWRQQGLETDDVEMNNRLRADLEEQLPGGMEVRVTDVANLSNPDKPLVLKYAIKGAVGAPTGKRLLIPASLFETNARPQFPSAKREQAVYMHYPSYTQDAVRYKYPASLALESAPADETGTLKTQAFYSISSKQAPGSVTLFRNTSMAQYLILPADYGELRTYSQKLETKDKDTLILVRNTTTASVSADKP